MMNLNKTLYHNSPYVFGIFFLFALLAFWPGYFGRLFGDIPTHIHIHGITMTVWCLMLIGQGFLIRLKKQRIHKTVGKISYLLVPLIVISGFNSAHYLLSRINMPPENFYSNASLMFSSLIAFGIIYGLAIKNRKQPLVHARYMVATIFPIITPLTDRLIHHHARPILNLVPALNGAPSVYVAGFVLAEVLLIGLVIWDWQFNRKMVAFRVALGIVLLYHISTLFFYHFSLWQGITDWIMSLPLS